MLLFMMLFSVPHLAWAQDRTYFNVCVALDESVTDENPDYQPGVDVNGNPVTPADLNEPLKAVNYPLIIPIEVDLLRLINNGSVGNTINLDPKVAEIKVFEDGHVEYNGQDISSYVNYTCDSGLVSPQQEDGVIEVPAAPETAPPVEAPKPKTPAVAVPKASEIKVIKEVPPTSNRQEPVNAVPSDTVETVDDDIIEGEAR